MSETLKPCPFCGGEAWVIQILEDLYAVECRKCWTRTGTYQPTEAEAIEAWNLRAERTAKVIEHDASITDTDGYKYQRSEYLCGNCKKKVIGGDEYCSHCGARLDWSEE